MQLESFLIGERLAKVNEQRNQRVTDWTAPLRAAGWGDAKAEADQQQLDINEVGSDVWDGSVKARLKALSDSLSA